MLAQIHLRKPNRDRERPSTENQWGFCRNTNICNYKIHCSHTYCLNILSVTIPYNSIYLVP